MLTHHAKRAWRSGGWNSEIFRKSSLNLNFGQDGCLESELARPISNRAILLEIFQRLGIVIFNINLRDGFYSSYKQGKRQAIQLLRLFTVIFTVARSSILNLTGFLNSRVCYVTSSFCSMSRVASDWEVNR